MNKLIKKIYYKIICYDPIIETLYITSNSDSTDNFEKSYVASPIFVTRKQKRDFYFRKKIKTSDFDSTSNQNKT